MRAAIYARVSTADGRQEAENQLSELRQFAGSQGWQLTGEYVDEESGKTAERERFQRLFADAARRRFDLILFWALDRFSREGAFETLQHLNRLSSYGVDAIRELANRKTLGPRLRVLQMPNRRPQVVSQ